MSTKSTSNLRRILMIALTSALFMHILKDIHVLYNIILVLLLGFSILLIFSSSKNFCSLNISTGIIFLLLLVYLLIIILISFFHLERFGMEYKTLVVAISRMMIMPLMAIIILNLIQEKKDFIYLLNINLFFIFIGSISLLLQHYYGFFEILGEGYMKGRYGVDGYSSTTGNVVTYGPSIALPLFYISFIYKKTLLKTFFISLISIGIFLTSSKAALINLLLCIIIIFIFFKYFKNKIAILLIPIIFVIYMSSDNNFYRKVASIASNTAGVEIDQAYLNQGLYLPLSTLIWHRIGGEWLSELPKMSDFIFGKGVIGAAGALSALLLYENHPFIENSPRTLHNGFLDIWQMGGIIFLFIFILFLINIQIKLFVQLYYLKDKISLVLFLSNLIFIINCFVLNGALFQPYVSFSIWLSFIYLIFIFNNRSVKQ